VSGDIVGMGALHLQDFQKEFKCHFNFDGGVDRPGILTINSEGEQIIHCAEVQVWVTDVNSVSHCC